MTVFAVDEKLEKALRADPIGNVTLTTIVEGFEKINAANEVLLDSDDGRTKVADIDKALKDKEKLPKKLQTLAERVEKAKETLKAAQTEARNTYRTEVLKEEPKDDSDENELKEAAQDARKMVNEAVKFLITYAQAHKYTDFENWATSLSVPQVGRQGSSSAGAKKPRVYVKVDETVHGSFSEAAAAISSKKQKVTASELAEAWNTATGGKEGSFEFSAKDDNDAVVNHTFVITEKPKKGKSDK